MSEQNQNGYVRTREFEAATKNICDKIDEIKKDIRADLREQKKEIDQDVQRVHHRVDRAEKRINTVEVDLSATTTKSDSSERKWERVFWVVISLVAGLFAWIIKGG